jgi:hypothetical protein
MSLFMATASDIAAQAIVSFPGNSGSDRRALKASKMTPYQTLASVCS